MFDLKVRILRWFFNRWYKKHPPEMVQWWKTAEACPAKVTEADDGSLVMVIQGEKYPFPGFPRGNILYGRLSPLKHWIKNWLFNDTWEKLENGMTEDEVNSDIRGPILNKILKLGEESRYDMLPPEKMSAPVREIHRAWTKIAKGSPRVLALRDIFCHIMNEDDAYRWRLQYVAGFFPKHVSFERALTLLEEAEVVGDMKERMRLLKRVLLVLLRDRRVKQLFDDLVKEIDWKKLELGKAEKYYFRAKFFKVDHPWYGY